MTWVKEPSTCRPYGRITALLDDPERDAPMTTTTNITTIDPRATLAELVNADVRRARVLEGLGLDYCCNGGRPLGEAVAAAGMDLAVVAAALVLPQETTAAPSAPSDLAVQAHEIVDLHHAYLWEEMPRLHALADKVAGVHGPNHPELARVLELYLAAEADLDPHLGLEERVVFPAISKLERTGQPVRTSRGPLEELVAQLVAEHDVVGDLFKEIRAVTDGYRVPEDGCGSYRALYDGLSRMEADLHLHIHKENNVLFPATLARIASL